ncbi:hypothetical protein K491DRAFT_775195 [Lophiostoma macrostomum CBS 122681]|uniref:F-box domain-containing protein n=1 Tax=Lophiostoma macrostomum CBS 122681 TaxID=1314788 RepID=A0A6A6TM04_9PLEO|nr:hypothetical protein K491DRAFT_775195 [Lophiostoma macrostomum CBS 122681]
MNKKRFNFMGLPPELRIIVYEYILGPNIYPRCQSEGYPSSRFQMAPVVLGISGHVLSNATKHESLSIRRHDRTLVGKRNLAILRVCRLIYEEALNAGWTGTRKCFFDIRRLQLVLIAFHGTGGPIGNARNLNWVGRIGLDFKDDDFFRLFGITLRPNTRYDSSCDIGPSLKSLPSLVDLQLHFKKYADVSGELWNSSSVCQRTYVDWVLTLAYPYIHPFQRVTIIGDVRKSSKVLWTYLLQGGSEGKTNGCNNDTELAAILQMTNPSSSAKCSCKVDCSECWKLHRKYGVGFDESDDGLEVYVRLSEQKRSDATTLAVRPGLSYSNVLKGNSGRA